MFQKVSSSASISLMLTITKLLPSVHLLLQIGQFMLQTCSKVPNLLLPELLLNLATSIPVILQFCFWQFIFFNDMNLVSKSCIPEKHIHSAVRSCMQYCIKF